MLTLSEKQKLKQEKKWDFLYSNNENRNTKNNSHLLIQKISLLAESICLGSESSVPVKIHFTKADSYRSACEKIFEPKDKYTISYGTWKDFKENYFHENYYFEDNSLENMLTEFQKLNAVYGEVLPEEYEKTLEEMGTRGQFYICFFLKINDKTNTDNILVVYDRYEGF